MYVLVHGNKRYVNAAQWHVAHIFSILYLDLSLLFTQETKFHIRTSNKQNYRREFGQEGRQSITLLEGSQDSPARPSCKSIMEWKRM